MLIFLMYTQCPIYLKHLEMHHLEILSLINKENIHLKYLLKFTFFILLLFNNKIFLCYILLVSYFILKNNKITRASLEPFGANLCPYIAIPFL